jgi:WD40 repeat protein
MQADHALKATKDAQLTQSRFLTDLADLAVKEGDAATGMLLALEALPDANDDDELKRSRPHWTPAAVSLDSARRMLRELAVLKGHTKGVTSVAVTPDGARIVTGSNDNTARVWDAKTFAELATLKGHTNGVTSVAVSPDRGRIVSGAFDHTARVWDARTFKEAAILHSRAEGVTAVTLSREGDRILAGGSDDTSVHLWTLLPAGQELVEETKIRAPRCLTPAERKKYFLAASPPRWCIAMNKWPLR